MHLTAAEARKLAEDILARRAYAPDDAARIAGILVEAHLWGRPNSGLQHLRQIVEAGKQRKPISVVREDARSAVLDGGNHPGLLVAFRAMTMAIAKAKAGGIATVSASNAFLGGIGGYYVDLAAREGLIGIMTISSGHRVAPAGGINPLFGTNPISVAFPTGGEPVIFDMATASINVGGLHRADRLGEPLPPGLAIDSDGQPTADPKRALAGAILPFGGHKGAVLSMMVQFFGLLGGGAIVPKGIADFGYFILTIDPSLFMPIDQYNARASELVGMVHTIRPIDPSQPVRVPGERAMNDRARHLVEGIEIDDKLYAELKAL